MILEQPIKRSLTRQLTIDIEESHHQSGERALIEKEENECKSDL